MWPCCQSATSLQVLEFLSWAGPAAPFDVLPSPAPSSLPLTIKAASTQQLGEACESVLAMVHSLGQKSHQCQLELDEAFKEVRPSNTMRAKGMSTTDILGARTDHHSWRCMGSVQTHFIKMIYYKNPKIPSAIWLKLSAGITETVSRNKCFGGHKSRRLQCPKFNVCGLIRVKEQAAPLRWRRRRRTAYGQTLTAVQK